jgi:hypothetical protein
LFRITVSHVLLARALSILTHIRVIALRKLENYSIWTYVVGSLSRLLVGRNIFSTFSMITRTGDLCMVFSSKATFSHYLKTEAFLELTVCCGEEPELTAGKMGAHLASKGIMLQHSTVTIVPSPMHISKTGRASITLGHLRKVDRLSLLTPA